MPESIGPPATLLPAQPTVLVVGDRRIAVAEWPLAAAVDERRSVELSRPEDDVLVIGPRPGTTAGMIGRSFLVALGGLLPTLVVDASDAPTWLAVLIGVVVAALVALLIRSQLIGQQWLCFDRPAGQLRIERRPGFGREHRLERTLPLATLQAVQLLYSGRHSVTEPQGAGEQQTTVHREYFGYELNLVLDDVDAGRLHLLALSDWRWVRKTGEALGAFLNVPVIDKLRHGG
jgi:hypothetical protein